MTYSCRMGFVLHYRMRLGCGWCVQLAWPFLLECKPALPHLRMALFRLHLLLHLLYQTLTCQQLIQLRVLQDHRTMHAEIFHTAFLVPRQTIIVKVKVLIGHMHHPFGPLWPRWTDKTLTIKTINDEELLIIIIATEICQKETKNRTGHCLF